ncbi:Sua5/YciO/YrdC/YwlC family protein [Flammeovirgaceae bacterium SG7u.111]|nr:Sua5/YciO/YrdC/YwlC family protein [Flammeovirgaceae bacterium SG7u.132]WPO36952.1 Sua5/YciO/YrdC/YwlC family protein [Flammeovirgaceae bacterium SG7u.111]
MQATLPRTIKILGDGLTAGANALQMVSLLAKRYGLSPEVRNGHEACLTMGDGNATSISNFLMALKSYQPLTEEFKLEIEEGEINISQLGHRINRTQPDYTLLLNDQRITDHKIVVSEMAKLLERGKIVAMKGKGGFSIICNAMDEITINQLRRLKRRGGKPFSAMFRDLPTLKEYVEVSAQEEEQVTSKYKPTVLLKIKKNLAGGVVNGLKSIGAKLPFKEIYEEIFDETSLDALVITSGNFPNEPIISDNEEAVNRLSLLCDAILVYDRKIKTRLDESCLMVANRKKRFIRRSRGFAPYQIKLRSNAEGIVAVGGEMFNTLALGKRDKAVISQQIGDLRNKPTLDFYKETYQKICGSYMVRPQLFVHDMNPAYLSTQFARKMSTNCLPVQHHHAHIASCMVENGLDEKVIGICFDGAGFGDDGKIWGGEFFTCDLANYERDLHLEYMPMPGGVIAVEEPWRMGLSYLLNAFGYKVLGFNIPFLKGLRKEKVDLLLMSLKDNMDSPFTSSIGRLFDAVAAIVNINIYKTFHSEASVRLESIADSSVNECYPFEMGKVIRVQNTIRAIVEDVQKGIPNAIISGKFHRTVVEMTLQAANMLRSQSHINRVVLSGGVFQNKLLLEWVEDALSENNFDVYSHSQVPFNDGGLALGQLAIASKRLAEIERLKEVGNIQHA